MLKTKQSPFVIFDIGSGSVGAALATISPENDIPMVLYSTRVPIAYKGDIYSDLFMRSMFTSFQNAALAIVEKGVPTLARKGIEVKDINKILCIFSSPWYKSQVDLLKFEKEKEFDVSESQIKEAITKINEEFKESTMVGDDSEAPKQTKLIEKDIVQMRLNGYPTNNPYGKRAKNVELSLFLSKISIDVHKNTQTILDKTFNTEDISYHSFSLVSFSVVRDIFNTEKNFLLIDIRGEVTDITLVRNETLYSTASFPIGRNLLAREVASALNTVPEEANSLVRVFLEGKGVSSESAKIRTILDKAEQKWLSSFRKALIDLSEGLSLPGTVFLTVDEDVSKWFEQAVKDEEFVGYTLAEKLFTVVTLSERQFHKYCITSGESSCDPFLTVEALFVHKIAGV